MKRFLLFSLLMLIVIAVSVVTVTAQDSPPTERNRANILAYVEYARNQRLYDLDRLLYHPTDYIVYSPFAPNGTPTSPDDFIAGEQAFLTAFPDMQITQYLVLAQGNYTAMIGYQEGTFENEYLGTPPSGQRIHGQIFTITEYDENGLAIADYNAWNQQGFMQDMGWSPVEYTFDMQPWDVELGVSSTSVNVNQNSVDRIMSDIANPNHTFLSFPMIYDENVVVHDYLGDIQGIDDLIAWQRAAANMPGFNASLGKSVCEGDLCATWGSGEVTMPDGSDGAVIWAALHRFEDGKIVEEWWLYDNSVIWAFVPPVQ